MLAIYLSPIYIILSIYIARWLLRWMGACSKHFKKFWTQAIVIVVYIFFASAILIGFFLPAGGAQRFVKSIGNYWLGVMLYVLLTVIIADIVRVILKRCKSVNQEKLRSRKTFVIVGAVSIAIIATLSIGGAINARIIQTTDYSVTVKKSAGDLDTLNIVMIADLHLGYNIGCGQMERMVRQINKENPDVVLIAGDIFDNEYEALDDPQRLTSILKGIKSKYGVYACYGNHDIQEKILAGFTFAKKGQKKESDVRMDKLLEQADVTLLKDEYVLIEDSVYIYGRPDLERPGRGIDRRKTPEEVTADLDKTKPIIVIDHQPKELQELADAGVDVDLCGHTHDGQMFPGNLTVRLMWENSCGYLRKDDMHNIVTAGVGVFGPNMRVGVPAEICQIRVDFVGEGDASVPAQW